MGGDSPFLGMVILVPFTFAPVGWALCNGSLISIAENDALFNLIGTTYGGDGQQTFALPDLRGRSPIHQGTGSSLSTHTLGEQAGTENVTLTAGQLPVHSHVLHCSNQTQIGSIPTNAIPAAGQQMYAAAANATLVNTTVSSIGGNLPHTNLEPFLAMNWIIALEGVFPSPS